MEKTKTIKILKKVGSVASYVLIALLLLIDIFALYSKFSMQGKEGGMNFFGREVRLVLTGSMDGSDEFYEMEENKDLEIKRIEQNDAVFVETVPYEDEAKSNEFYSSLKVGDILTFYFQLGTNIPVTHRIIKITDHETYYTYELRGDNPSGDQQVSKYSPTQVVNSDSGLVIGKVTGKSSFLGRVLYAFVEHKVVLALVVIVPSAIFMCYEIGKIIYYIYLNKKSKKEEETKILEETKQKETDEALKEKDDELKRLKEELERLKKGETNDE